MDIKPMSAVDLETRIADFAALLQACVSEGASVNFIAPFSLADAEAFWRRKVQPRLGDNGLVLLAVTLEDRIAGAIQLDCDTPPNQPHRADVKKVLVHPYFQRRGIGRAMLTAIEEAARQRDRWLLTLDTRSGDKGEPLYIGAGYQVAGIVPYYSRDVDRPVFDAATFLYKIMPWAPVDTAAGGPAGAGNSIAG
jgi:ribosomal protein S18 acetylase RimI-like enzyme